MPFQTLEVKLQKFSQFFMQHYIFSLFLLFFFALILRLLIAPYNSILRADSYFYLLKAQEIFQGFYTPMHSHAIGWPIVLAAFFLLLKPFFTFSPENFMIFSRILSSLLGALVIFPLAYIGTYFLSKRYSLWFLLFYASSYSLLWASVSGGADTLFLLLFLLSICFLLFSFEKSKYYLFLSIFFAGLAYWVRPNGLLLLPILILSVIFFRDRITWFSWKYIAFIIILFFLFSAPFLYQRYSTFGSAFDYGENSKYFSDSATDLWNSHVEIQGIFAYLSTHSFLDIFQKFFINGFLMLLWDYLSEIISYIFLFGQHPAPIFDINLLSEGVFFFFYVVLLIFSSLVLLSFFFYGLYLSFSSQKYFIIYIIFVIWILAFSLVWSILHDGRYLLPTLPFIFIFILLGCERFVEKKYPMKVLTAFFFLFIGGFFLPFILSGGYLSPAYAAEDPATHAEWAEWVATNLTNAKIVAIDGADVVMFYATEPHVGGKDMMHPYDSNVNISFMDPGYFEDFDSAMAWYKEEGATHIIFDYLYMDQRPFLDIESPPSYLFPVYIDIDPNEDYDYWPLVVSQINWTEYDRITSV